MTLDYAFSSLFPAAPPFDEGWLAVGSGHRIYYSQRGNPQGIPALVIHGGPGSGSSPQQARFFDPMRYRVVQFDQRGSGRSEPVGEISDNTTELLLQDIDVLRQHLAIDRWLVTGGSWGAALGAVYAARHRADVTGLLLRGMFLAQQQDIEWFFRDAANEFPAAWSRFADCAPSHLRQNLLAWLHVVFAKGNDIEQMHAARSWYEWEQTLGGAVAVPSPDSETLNALCRRYRVQSHYLVNQCWLDDDAVVKACAAIGNDADMPVRFVHGELDRVCPLARARLAHVACAGSTLEIATGAGHDPFHPAMVALMRQQLDGFANR